MHTRKGTRLLVIVFLVTFLNYLGPITTGHVLFKLTSFNKALLQLAKFLINDYFFHCTVCWREVACLYCQSANSLASFPSLFYPRLLPSCSTLDQVMVMWQTIFDKLSAAPPYMWLKLQRSCKEYYERRDSGTISCTVVILQDAKDCKNILWNLFHRLGQ